MNLLTGLLAVVLACASSAGSAKSLVRVSSLQQTYDRSQPVTLTIENTSPNRIRTYSNVEVLDKRGQWITWPFRAEDGRHDTIAMIYPLDVGHSVTISFDIRKLPPLPPRPRGEAPAAKRLQFRFRVVVLRADSDDQVEELFSAPFDIRNPYG